MKNLINKVKNWYKIKMKGTPPPKYLSGNR